MVVFDSDILVGILREQKEAVDFMDKMSSENEEFSTTTINAYEIIQGALLSPKAEIAARKVENFLLLFNFLEFNYPASRIAAEISADLRKKGKMIDIQDIFIAAIAKLHNEAIVTRNVKHFSKIKGIEIKEW